MKPKRRSLYLSLFSLLSFVTGPLRREEAQYRNPGQLAPLSLALQPRERKQATHRR